MAYVTWENYFIILGLHFLTCKMEIIIPTVSMWCWTWKLFNQESKKGPRDTMGGPVQRPGWLGLPRMWNSPPLQWTCLAFRVKGWWVKEGGLTELHGSNPFLPLNVWLLLKTWNGRRKWFPFKAHQTCATDSSLLNCAPLGSITVSLVWERWLFRLHFH